MLESIYIYVQSWTTVLSHTQMFLFSCVNMCKYDGDKRWAKQDILRVFSGNIQENHAHYTRCVRFIMNEISFNEVSENFCPGLYIMRPTWDTITTPKDVCCLCTISIPCTISFQFSLMNYRMSGNIAKDRLPFSVHLTIEESVLSK